MDSVTISEEQAPPSTVILSTPDKTVTVETETKESRTEHNVPHLAFVGMKSYPQCFGDRKNRSGHGPEHAAANVENASRTLAIEIAKAQAEPILSDDGQVPYDENGNAIPMTLEKAQEIAKNFTGKSLVVAKPTEN